MELPISGWVLHPGLGDSWRSAPWVSGEERSLAGLALSSTVMVSFLSFVVSLVVGPSHFTGLDLVFLTSFLPLTSSLDSTELVLHRDLLRRDSMELGRDDL